MARLPLAGCWALISCSALVAIALMPGSRTGRTLRLCGWPTTRRSCLAAREAHSRFSVHRCAQVVRRTLRGHLSQQSFDGESVSIFVALSDMNEGIYSIPLVCGRTERWEAGILITWTDSVSSGSLKSLL